MIPHFEPESAALLLIDYQVGTLQLAKTNPSDVSLRNAITLAKAALAFDMPIVVTSSQEDKIQGRIDERLQHVVPDAFEARVRRVGIVDAWKDPNFKRAVEDGHEVQAVMDAYGSQSEINEAISRERLKCAGVHTTVTSTMVAELVQDWSTPQGRQLVQLLFAAAPMQPVE